MNPNVRAPASKTSSSILLRERENDIEILILNRPQARNSLSKALLGALSDTLTEISKDHATRAVVIAASGSAFSAGHDLKELTSRRSDRDGGREFFRHIMESCSAMMQQIVTLPQPVIAAVQGVASAAGCQLVASCDLAVASAAAQFATPGVDIGLFCSTPMVALSRNIARKHAMEMLLTGDMVSAERAAQMGLVNRVVPQGEERNSAIALARQIAAKSTHVVKIGKQAFYRQTEMSLADAYRFASEVMTENMMARDAKEGICAFIDKRNPKWEDR
ncbi:MAG TPA: enoyl-CoA hydratase [Pseudolabrys sp.]|nr:enoyl-CoA hydratase [Pseudolabrys sp.]